MPNLRRKDLYGHVVSEVSVHKCWADGIEEMISSWLIRRQSVRWETGKDKITPGTLPYSLPIGLLPPARLHLLKFPQPPKTAPPAAYQVNST